MASSWIRRATRTRSLVHPRRFVGELKAPFCGIFLRSDAPCQLWETHENIIGTKDTGISFSLSIFFFAFATATVSPRCVLYNKLYGVFIRLERDTSSSKRRLRNVIQWIRSPYVIHTSVDVSDFLAYSLGNSRVDDVLRLNIFTIGSVNLEIDDFSLIFNSWRVYESLEINYLMQFWYFLWNRKAIVELHYLFILRRDYFWKEVFKS